MKRKIFVIALVVCIAVMMFASATMAYFTDTKQTTNVFTAGNVYIELSEAAVKADAVGNLVEDASRARLLGTETGIIRDYGKLYPGQIIHKDPTVTNTGSEEAWIAAKVTLSDGSGSLPRIMGYPDDPTGSIDIEVLLGGELLDEQVHVGTWNGFEDVCHNDSYAMLQIPDAADGEYVFYFFMLEKQAPDATIKLFNTLTVPAEWGNEQMKELIDLEIDVQAFAVQTFGFASCYDAMTAAFSEHFDLP